MCAAFVDYTRLHTTGLRLALQDSRYTVFVDQISLRIIVVTCFVLSPHKAITFKHFCLFCVSCVCANKTKHAGLVCVESASSSLLLRGGLS